MEIITTKLDKELIYDQNQQLYTYNNIPIPRELLTDERLDEVLKLIDLINSKEILGYLLGKSFGYFIEYIHDLMSVIITDMSKNTNTVIIYWYFNTYDEGINTNIIIRSDNKKLTFVSTKLENMCTYKFTIDKEVVYHKQLKDELLGKHLIMYGKSSRR